MCSKYSLKQKKSQGTEGRIIRIENSCLQMYLFVVWVRSISEVAPSKVVYRCKFAKWKTPLKKGTWFFSFGAKRTFVARHNGSEIRIGWLVWWYILMLTQKAAASQKKYIQILTSLFRKTASVFPICLRQKIMDINENSPSLSGFCKKLIWTHLPSANVAASSSTL